MSKYAENSSVKHDCSPEKGYTNAANNYKDVGYITKLKVGDTEFEADQNLEGPDGEVKALGVIKNFKWEATDVDPLLIDFLVSTEGRVSIKELLQSSLDKLAVEISAKIYSFDNREGKQKYFEAVDLDGIKGVLKEDAVTKGTTPCFDVEAEKAPWVEKPENYFASIEINPQGKNVIGIAVSSDAKIKKQFGK